MKKHTKVYLDFFGYGEQSFIPSEISGKPATQIHHIIPKSKQGKDEIENLIGLSFEEHEQAHFRRQPYLTRECLQEEHKKFIERKKYID
jgi:5-methylcytosine-specific restriction endonuclease McrA